MAARKGGRRSERRVVRILKVARTIADLAGEDSLSPKYLWEAVQYRTLDRNLLA
jgi:magnesium chelatase family protein